jgi:uncharacterized protein with ParB-like and HNH nuclease domain
MSYQTTTIAKILSKANATELCLPAIQRKYIWKKEQIERLFDSIYLDYPIGTFLIWDVPHDEIENYRFYSLLKDFDEQHGNFNSILPSPYVGENFQSVLDGQQRITSLYIGLQGSYKSRNPNGKKNSLNSYTERNLYFNLMQFKSFQILEEEQTSKLFKMLSSHELSNNNDFRTNAWIKLSDLTSSRWLSGNDFNDDLAIETLVRIIGKELWDDIFENSAQNQRLFLKHIERIVKKIHLDEVISYYEIKNQTKLDEVAEIFIRINSGGITLSKSDLLFSTVISGWEEGREKIDDLIKDIKNIGFEIDTDFVMRTSLYLTGSPILFKADNFKPIVVDKIRDLFETNDERIDIKTSIINTFSFLKIKLGLTEKIINRKNLLIPIIYHKFMGGRLDNTSVVEVRKYIYVSKLQKVFGSHGDSLLANLRTGVMNGSNYVLNQLEFNYNVLISGLNGKDKFSLYIINEEVIDDYLNKKKGPEAWLVLSLIYDDLQYDYENFDQDHLHPKSKLTANSFPNINFKDEIEFRRDRVPNLCFSTLNDNRWKKNDSSLENYVNVILPDNNQDPAWYKQFNKIDANQSLDLNDFIDFYENRKRTLKNILLNKIGGDLFRNQTNENHFIDTAIENEENLIEIVPIDVPLIEFDQQLNIPNEVINLENELPNQLEIDGELVEVLPSRTTLTFTDFYNTYMTYVIDLNPNFLNDFETLKKYFKLDPEHIEFGRGVHYNRIRTHNGISYSTYFDNSGKLRIMNDIAQIMNLNFRLIY